MVWLLIGGATLTVLLLLKGSSGADDKTDDGGYQFLKEYDPTGDVLIFHFEDKFDKEGWDSNTGWIELKYHQNFGSVYVYSIQGYWRENFSGIVKTLGEFTVAYLTGGVSLIIFLKSIGFTVVSNLVSKGTPPRWDLQYRAMKIYVWFSNTIIEQGEGEVLKYLSMVNPNVYPHLRLRQMYGGAYYPNQVDVKREDLL